jgi:putative tryptophan/tyrosine transport system substrate-binding protein
VVMSRSLAPYKKVCHGLSDFSQDNIIRYNIEGSAAQARVILDQVAASGADAVVTIGTEATLAVRDTLPGIPVVYSLVLEPQTFSNKPSAGVLLAIPVEAELSLVKTVLPRAKTLGVIYDANYSSQAVSRLREEMDAKGLRLLSASVTSAAEIPRVLEKFTADQVDALFSLTDPTTSNPEAFQLQIKHCLKNKIPFWADSEQAVKDGAFLALTADYEAAGLQTGALVRQLLETRTSLAAQPPKKMLLFVNEGTRKSLGLAELPTLTDVTTVRY